MTIRCRICQLEPEKQAAIAEALRESVPLQVISDRTGLSKSSIWRHSKHLAKAAGQEKAPKAVVTPRAKTPVPAPPRPTALAHTVQTPDPAAPLEVEAKRRQGLDRTEQLWGEVSECLQAAKEPVVVVKPDGSTLEVPVDLRTRSSVIRAGKDVIDLDARLNGLYDNPAAAPLGSVVFENVILMPKIPELEPPENPEPKVIDARREPENPKA
jgi:hypothetical protein